jgi:cytochrome c-type biogenesis protein CcmF
LLDSYAQNTVAVPGFEQPLALPDGYTVTFALDDVDLEPDGSRGAGFRSVARVGWRLERDGEVLAAEGHSVYRDARPPARGGQGPVRLMCEILDYRYARYVSGTEQMIHPFIHRGLWRDVQIWVPAFTGLPDADGMLAERNVPVVLKVYPLIGWLWIGLVLAVLGAAWRFVVARRAQPGSRRA